MICLRCWGLGRVADRMRIGSGRVHHHGQEGSYHARVCWDNAQNISHLIINHSLGISSQRHERREAERISQGLKSNLDSRHLRRGFVIDRATSGGSETHLDRSISVNFSQIRAVTGSTTCLVSWKNAANWRWMQTETGETNWTKQTNSARSQSECNQQPMMSLGIKNQRLGPSKWSNILSSYRIIGEICLCSLGLSLQISMACLHR